MEGGIIEGLDIQAVVARPEESELVRYPTDEIWLRLIGHGEVQVGEYRSVDRDGPPAHRHPWDELQIVADGEVEFSLDGGPWIGGGPGTVQLLPRGVSHTLRVPVGEARLFQVSIGPPYDGFARDMARLFETGADLVTIAASAERHGVSLALALALALAGIRPKIGLDHRRFALQRALPGEMVR